MSSLRTSTAWHSLALLSHPKCNSFAKSPPSTRGRKRPLNAAACSNVLSDNTRQRGLLWERPSHNGSTGSILAGFRCSVQTPEAKCPQWQISAILVGQSVKKRISVVVMRPSLRSRSRSAAAATRSAGGRSGTRPPPETDVALLASRCASLPSGEPCSPSILPLRLSGLPGARQFCR